MDPQTSTAWAQRMRTPGGSDAAQRFARDLGMLEESAWPELLEELEKIARALATRFDDVAAEQDILGELALHTHERWLAQWAEGVRAGGERRSLALFLRDRLRDHLREERRKTERRRTLLAARFGPSRALFATTPVAPEDMLAAEEVRRQLDSDVLDLKAAGYTGREIARRLGSSQATVSRRLAALGAALLAALAALLFWLTRPEPLAPIVEPVTGESLPLHAPAGDGDEEAPAPTIEAAESGEEAPEEDETSAPPTDGAEPAPEDSPSEESASEESAAEAATEVTAPEATAPPPVDATPEQRLQRARQCTGARYADCVVRALGPSPRSEEARARLIRARVDLHDYEEARRQIRAYLRAFPRGRHAIRYARELNELPVADSIERVAARCDHARDHACVVRELAASASTAPELELLIDAYIALGQSGRASHHINHYLRRFPRRSSTPRYRDYLLGHVRRVQQARIDGRPLPESLQPPRPSPVSRYERWAVECTQRGDNQCVIRTLEGHARTPRALRLLIEAYRAQSRQSAALRHMRTFVSRWPNTPQGRNYQMILNVQGR